MPAGEDPLGSARRDAERRDIERVEILGALHAEVVIPQPLTITDISAAGLQALSVFPFQLETVHEFRLTLDRVTVVIKGQVVHASVVDLGADVVEYRTGVDFVDLPDSARRALDGYASRLRRSRDRG